MLLTPPPDSPYTPDTSGEWISLSQLAKREGITKQTLGAKIAKFEAQGLLPIRELGKGKGKLIHLGAYDRLRAFCADPVREQAAKRVSGAISLEMDDPVLLKEQARRTAYQADLSKLELEEKIGQLIPIEAVEAKITACAEALVRALDQLPNRADEILGIARGGKAQEMRVFLKTIAYDLRRTMVSNLKLLEHATGDFSR